MDLRFQGSAVLALQKAAEAYSIWLDYSGIRTFAQPTREARDDHAERHPACTSHPRRAISIGLYPVPSTCTLK